jgi:hypothetical protein
MIANKLKHLHPIDQRHLLANGVSCTQIDGSIPVVSSGYVASVCHICREFALLGGPQIDGFVVCPKCYHANEVIDNTLPCPYKDPKRRKYKSTVKTNGLA